MTDPLRPSRRLPILGGAVAAGALLLTGGLTTTSAVAASAPAASTPASVAACAPTASEARVKEGKSMKVDPTELTAARVASYQRVYAAGLKQAGLKETSKSPVGKVTIDVRVHVILRDDGTGGPTKQQMDDQIKVLNAGYGGTSSSAAAKTEFTFKTKSVDYTRNTDWYNWSYDGDTDDHDAKTALHKGGFDDLNVYYTGLEDGLLGYSTFPFERKLALDGVVVLTDSLPGGAAAPYNQGDTLTHEAGHWLGLFHTFENGCKYPGDTITDTPYQADGDNIFFCRESDDTCPASGLDPVHNFMSYGDDPCLDRFTRGQAQRTALAWYVFRSGEVLDKH